MTSAISPLPNIRACPENINSALCRHFNNFGILVWVARLFCGKEKSEPPGQPHPELSRVRERDPFFRLWVMLFIQDIFAIDIEVNMFPLVANLGIDQLIGIHLVFVGVVQIGFSVAGHVHAGIHLPPRAHCRAF